ncbi:Pimeloyl-ACP methyl ester carboxylesterase [Flavobacteriaceae bacterium MAR_2010_188]|nr:Pimeloyl-ACP methyl ester carboxylesterase [Flavobacteriaceae bacterium MAR_2010_188]
MVLKYIIIGSFVSMVLLILSSAGIQIIESPDFRCDCSEFEIENNWAESNNITCYRIPVSQTFNNISTGKISLAVIVAKKTGNTKTEPLLYLHGGPGLSTLSNAKKYLTSNAFIALREEQDLIMFDYRGTGYSEPSLCEDLLDSLKIYRKTNPSAEAFQKKRIELYLQCKNSLPQKRIDINSFSSFQLAADAEAVREALVIKQWNVYGVSYGTLVALHYIKNFPENLKSIILDSPFPPNVSSFDYVHPMNETLQHMQRKIKANPSTAAKFPDIIGDFSKTANRLNEDPIKIDDDYFNGDDFAQAMLIAFYKTKVVPLIPLAMHEFAKGNVDQLKPWIENLSSSEDYGKTNDIQGALIDCYECKARKPQYTPDSLQVSFPYLATLAEKDYKKLCEIFRPERPLENYYESVKSNLPVLVLSGEFDPGMPPSFGQATIESLTNSTFVVIPNASHAAMHYNECSLNIVESFLKNPLEILDLGCIENIDELEFATDNLEEELKELIAKEN